MYLPTNTHPTIIEGYKQQQALYAGAMRSKQVSWLHVILDEAPSYQPWQTHPVSRGTVRLNVSDPEGEPIVDYRGVSNPVDLDIMVEIVKFLRRFMTTGVLAKYDAVETVPGSEVQTDDQLAEWARAQIIPSVYHPIGTASKMPRKWGGVVNEELLVYGLERLSVADASIMPVAIGGTTSMTVYAIAEKVGHFTYPLMSYSASS
jgi:choline dehydrogenase-like flavoprotein